MTELELLQKKHREEAARRRASLKERKRRTHRLIERGAILESAINEVVPAVSLSNSQIEQLVFFSVLAPKSIQLLMEMGR
ncbi:MAG: DUF3847 domain-containing protein [Lachnoclostridium sp.]|nr:DUF3847 domain-containing protein [Lachnoclostridium sp.]